MTHSLIGLGAGELLQRSLPAEGDPQHQRTRRRLLLTACWAASNFPDLDLLLVRLLPSPLGYLLQHRGHTHTLLYALPQALLLLALLWLLWPGASRLLRHSGAARAGLAASVLLGFGLHFSMDYLNSYGIHPFYPFDTRWFYGDISFIVEPLFWVAFGAPLAMMVGRTWLRIALLAVLALLMPLFAWKGLLAWISCMALLALGIGLAALQRRAGAHGRQALLAGLAVGIGFIVLQGGASALGRARIEAALRQADPAARVLDVAMTAFPSQPLCWTFVTVESMEVVDSYRLRRGIASIAPHWLAPQDCPAGLAGAPGRALAEGVVAQDEGTGSLALLRRLRRGDCHLDAWLRFARAPLVSASLANDMRFTAGMGRNFSTLDVAPSGRRGCPPGAIPAWGYPRADLLDAPVAGAHGADPHGAATDVAAQAAPPATAPVTPPVPAVTAAVHAQ